MVGSSTINQHKTKEIIPSFAEKMKGYELVTLIFSTIKIWDEIER
jgi:hypothetical protein